MFIETHNTCHTGNNPIVYNLSSINPNAQNNSIYLGTMWNSDADMIPNWRIHEFNESAVFNRFAIYNPNSISHRLKDLTLQYAESGDGPWMTLNEWTALNSSGWQYLDINASLTEYKDYRFCKLYINSTYSECQVWSNEVQINFGIIKIYFVSLHIFAPYSSIMIHEYK